MKTKFLFAKIVLVGFSGTFILNAQENNPILTVVPFITIAPDSRAGAMGDAGVATSPDCYSLHWNPAKYAFIKGEGGAGISYSPWLRSLVPDINIAYLTGYKRLDKKQVAAASLMYSSLGDIPFTDDFGSIERNFTPTEFAIDACYSRLLSDRFSGSIAFRFIYSNLTGGVYSGGTATKPGISFAADIAGYYTRNIEMGSREGDLSFGLNFSNIGSKMTYTDSNEPDFIPMNMRLGAAWTIELDTYNKITLASDLNKLLVPTPPEYDLDRNIVAGMDPNVSVPVAIIHSFYDAPGGFREEINEITYSFGTEYLYHDQFAIRGGYFHEHESKGNRKYFTLGAGFNMNILSLDFSYLLPLSQNHPLANTLRFSISFNIGNQKSVKNV